MPIHMVVEYYDKKPDWTPDYDKRHNVVFEGLTPADCMIPYIEMCKTHDLAKYTIAQIAYIY